MKNRYRAVGLASAGLLAAATLVGAGDAQADPTTIYVNAAADGNPATCGSTISQCKTIQDGIARASAGDTVVVAAGTYNESVDIEKAITLVTTTGAVIDGAGQEQADTSRYGVVYVGNAGGHVTVSGFTVKNPIEYAGNSGVPMGIVLQDTDAADAVTVTDNTVTGTPAFVDDGEVGIYSLRNAATTFIADNDVSGVFQGIFLEDNGPATISGNALHGLTDAGGFPAEGVFILSDLAGTLTDQNVTNNVFANYNGIGIQYRAGYDNGGCSVTACDGSVSGTVTGNKFALGANATTHPAAALVFQSLNAGNTLALVQGGNTGTVAAPTTPLRVVTTNGGTVTTTPSGTPDKVVPTAPPTLAVSTPTVITAGDPVTAFSGTAANPAAGADLTDVRYDIAIKGSTALAASDVTLQYQTNTDDSNPTFATVPLTGTASSGTGITGYFGPAAGFTFPAGASATTHFRLSIAGGAAVGSYSSTVTLDQVSPGTGNPVINTLATDSDTIDIVSQYVSVTPTRVVDTRTAGNPLHAGPLVKGTAYTLTLAGTGVPLDEAAYVFNVTAVHPSGNGNLAIQPACGSGDATTSIVNYQVKQDVANDVVVANPLSDGSARCNEFTLFSTGSASNVVIDLQGYITSPTGYVGSTPARIADTRSGLGGSTGVLAAGTVRTFTVTNVPAGAQAVAINLTAVQPSGSGNLRVYPADVAARPTTSNINYIKGVDKAAFAIVRLPSDHRISVYSEGSSADVVVDVFGYEPTTGTAVLEPSPVRTYDSRTTGGPVVAGTPRSVVVTGGAAAVPADAAAVVLSLTAAHVAGANGVGNLRAYATGTTPGAVSNVNYLGPNTDVANLAIVPVGTGGSITVATEGASTHVIVDIVGFIPGNSAAER